MVVNRDDKTTSSIDFTGLYEVGSFRINFYYNIRCLNLESFDTGNVGSKESIFLTDSFALTGVSRLGGTAPVGQEIPWLLP